MINVEIRGCHSGEVYAAGTEEEAHQFLLENYPATKRKMKNGPNNIIRVYPEPLYKKKVRGDRI